MQDGAKYDKLSSVSTIRTGLTLRNEFRLQEKGNIAVLQPKDILNGELINPPSYINAPKDSIKQHLLSEGDLLIANKGQKFGTLLYRNEFPNVIGSASFFVIKTNPKKYIPEFLQWYLELPQTKNYLFRNSTTSTIPSLSKSVLNDLQVPIPGINVQKKITDLISVIKTELSLLNQLIKKNEEYRDSYAWEVINNMI